MITRFKLYEYLTDSNPRFKIGDFVYCIENFGSLRKNIKYEIESVKCIQGLYFYKLKNINNRSMLTKSWKYKSRYNDTNNWSMDDSYVESRFMSEAEYNANKYNI